MTWQNLKAAFAILLLFFALGITPLSYSDDISFLPAGKLGRAMKANRKKQDDKPASPGPDKIVGHCTLNSGTGNLGDGPCVEILLILNDKNGAEVVRTRTDKNGNFVFEAQENSEYNILSGSKFAEVVSPKQLVSSGKIIELQLQQK